MLEPAVEAVAVDRHLLNPLAPSVLIDACIAGDLVDPGAEVDRAIGRPQAPERRDEDLLGEIVGAIGIAGPTQGKRLDAPAVAFVELLEGTIVAVARSVDELLVVRHGERHPGRLFISTSPVFSAPTRGGSTELYRLFGGLPSAFLTRRKYPLRTSARRAILQYV